MSATLARRLSIFPLCFSLVPGLGSAQGTIDPLNPASCTTEKGWIDVATAFLKALSDARASGRITEQQHVDLSVWFSQMENYLLQTNDTKGFCEGMILARQGHGF
jgi:hypothetical protein